MNVISLTFFLVSAFKNVVSFKFKLLVFTFMNDVLSCFSFFKKSIKPQPWHVSLVSAFISDVSLTFLLFCFHECRF